MSSTAEAPNPIEPFHITTNAVETFERQAFVRMTEAGEDASNLVATLRALITATHRDDIEEGWEGEKPIRVFDLSSKTLGELYAVLKPNVDRTPAAAPWAVVTTLDSHSYNMSWRTGLWRRTPGKAATKPGRKKPQQAGGAVTARSSPAVPTPVAVEGLDADAILGPTAPTTGVLEKLEAAGAQAVAQVLASLASLAQPSVQREATIAIPAEHVEAFREAAARMRQTFSRNMEPPRPGSEEERFVLAWDGEEGPTYREGTRDDVTPALVKAHVEGRNPRLFREVPVEVKLSVVF